VTANRGSSATAEHDSDEATLAVVAHSLMASMTVLEAGIATLRTSWDRLEDGQKGQILDAVITRTGFLRGMLEDLVRGMPPDTVALLDSLGGPISL